MAYAVKEIFLTLQGEGVNAGRVAVFCRFAGCNLWSGREKDRATAVCRLAGPGGPGGCDTDFLGTNGMNGGKYATAEDLASKMSSLWPDDSKVHKLCVMTGGEPMLQFDPNLGYALRHAGFDVAMETNGTRPVTPRVVDHITVSPKAGTVLLQTSGTELKIVYPQKGVDPADFEKLDFKHFMLSPMWTPDPAERRKNAIAAVKYCLEHPRWRLSVQTHKVLEIP